jgi:xanthine dehydrogenase YagS FAD-binding subunit
MQAFEYARPTTTQDAIKLLSGASGDVQVLAGGTDLISLMKDGISSPARVVSLQHVKELRGITFTPSKGLRLGATATIEELLENADVRKHYPALIQAVEGLASQQVRNTGTVAGNLCQRPRCWYYRAGFGLLATRNGKALVPEGDNRYHAILGNSGPAYFISPSSLAPILMALNAKVKLQGPQGARELTVQEFFVTPKSEQESEHALRPGEIVTEVVAPAPGNVKMALYEVRHREALEWPMATAAVVLHMDGSTVKSARVVLGHVAPVPWPSPEAEGAVTGQALNEEVAWNAGKAALSAATPLSKNAYKVQLARVAVKRALLRAAKGEA